MQVKYYMPSFGADHFNCPHCNVYSAQDWFDLFLRGGGYVNADFLKICYCEHCGNQTVWINKKCCYPDIKYIAHCHAEMPAELVADYDEAAAVYSVSPKSSAALLRLLLQKLLIFLGESGKNINKDIQSLVGKGLPQEVQMALDVCRVVGNCAVHPGEIDVNDSSELVLGLFQLINFIVEERVARPRRIKNMYDSLPVNALKGIDERDGKK
ncbi:MAG: DUF4145 domain-containing protein [Solidesulfovibrio sp. DCME]|uniref:DUF4145 domain-containing protein n=1 Tax=Solidesulfovibrio sp. DCME TaxID=3447380 RepID=UPI003D0F5DCD